MKALFILNDPPYGTERVYNALRRAQALLKKEPQMELTVFLMADAVVAGKSGQKTPDGYYNVERMLKRALAGNVKVLLCGTCMHGRAWPRRWSPHDGRAPQHDGRACGGHPRGGPSHGSDPWLPVGHAADLAGPFRRLLLCQCDIGVRDNSGFVQLAHPTARVLFQKPRFYTHAILSHLRSAGTIRHFSDI